MASHVEITQNNKFGISLKYPKKEVEMALSLLVEVTKHVQSTQNKKLVMFLQYLKKNF